MSATKTVVISVLNPHLIDQFHSLPPAFSIKEDDTYEAVRVVKHHDPMVSIDYSLVDANFDLIFIAENRSDVDWVYKDLVKTVDLPRKPKWYQAALLAAKAQELNLTAFKPTRAFFVKGDEKIGAWNYGTTLHDKLVIKCNDGARGIGQILVDLTKTPVASINAVLREVSIIRSDSDKSREDRHTEISKLFEDKGFIYNTESEYSLGEGLESLFSQGWHGSAYVSDVQYEFRVLVEGDNLYGCSRHYKGSDAFKQATGVKDTVDDESSLLPLEKVLTLLDPTETSDDLKTLGSCFRKIVVELKQLLKAAGIDYGSVDLFITETGQWGIFEYCNQFGTAAFTGDAMFRYHRDYVKRKLIEHNLLPLKTGKEAKIKNKSIKR